MAAVLDALVSYVKNLIADMAQEEVSMLLGVSGAITKLEDNMESVKAFLADAERRRITDESVQRWVRKLKDAMYDTTDILDLCQLEADERRQSKGGSFEDNVPDCFQPLLLCFQPLLFCLRNPVFAHEIGSRIEELNQRLEDIHKGAAQFNFSTNLSSYQDQRMLNDAQHSSRKTISGFDETDIVGRNIEQDTNELAHMLTTHDDHDLKVVYIVGMGGVGKTTLAQKIFNEETVQEHFKIRIWLSITKNFDEIELLRIAISQALEQLAGKKKKNEEKQIQTCGYQRQIQTCEYPNQHLSAKKFLVVMDDVWGENPWNDVLRVPINKASREQPGSRVLVTTRSEDLPCKMQASLLHQHRVLPLDEEDSWFLLKKQLPLDQGQVDQLKRIGMEILKRCDGLPLAIKVMGVVLSNRYPSEREWKAVLDNNNPAWSIDGQRPQELDNLLYLSYEDLPPQLKQCFVYCTLFPKGTYIPLDLITRMWISEGFIQPPERNGNSHDDDRLESVAKEYYWDLIRRNFMQPLSGGMCILPDVVCSFAEYMASEEMLVLRDEQGAARIVRRLSTAPTAVSVPDWTTLKKQKSLRTLAIFSSVKFMPGDSLACFSSLRVLYISGPDSDLLVDSVCCLKHLRLLCLYESNISRLPDDIHKMKFLQFIILRNCKKLANLPSSIVKLEHLRSLDMTGTNVSVPKGFGGLTNLRALFGFPVQVDDMYEGSSSWCSLQELAPLSQLRDLALCGLEKVHASWMVEKAMISSKAHLSYLELKYNKSASGGQMNKQQQQEVLEKLCPPTCLENLSMVGGYVGRQLPNWMRAPASADFKSMRYLNLEDLLCRTQLPDGLCCLPCLEVLIIKHAPAVKCIGPEFQAPSSASTSTPFPKLRHMQLVGLCEWEEWEWNCCVEQGGGKAAIAMPCLETLYIKNCKLRRLPPGLANSNRHALREVYLYGLTNLAFVENFPSVVELHVLRCPKLKRISALSRLHMIRIFRCPKLKVLKGVPALDSLKLNDITMKALPEYLPGVNPRYLSLRCNKMLHESVSTPGSSEWNKISHIRNHDISYK